MKVYIKNQQRLIKANQHKIKKNLSKALHILGLNSAEISILLVNDKRMKILNKQYRGINKTTDVLSFPQIPKFEIRNSKFLKSAIHLPCSALLLGDIVINLHQAKRQAIEHNLTFNEELNLLLIHGLLHLVGYDHEKGGSAKKKMKKKTREILKKLQED